jgi:hypothetical protein
MPDRNHMEARHLTRRVFLRKSQERLFILCISLRLLTLGSDE